ncbi:MAG: hypothetical protein JWO40_471 [Candidatus Doudnabacteria bacterium]|nr:hypothetical protein [Candidatus Doudnabacteria bacterium]
MTMTTTITSDASVTTAGPSTDEQIGHLKGLLDPRLRRLSDPLAQILIHAGGQFQEMFDSGLDSLLGKLVVEAAIVDGKFDYKYVSLPIEKFPLTEEPLDGVEELHFNQVLTTRQILANIDGKSQKCASPLTALRYAAKFPGKQLEYVLAVIFEIDGQPQHLILDRQRSERSVHVSQDYLDGNWNERCRFLVVAAK